jgi:hypothetical protein
MKMFEAFPGNHNLHFCQSQEQSQLMKGVYLSLPRSHQQTLQGRLGDSCGRFLTLTTASAERSLQFSASVGVGLKLGGIPQWASQFPHRRLAVEAS